RSCRSTRCSGLANRSFIIGIRLCPPATTRASSPCCAKRPMASSKERGRWYSNGAGIIPGSSRNSLPHPLAHSHRSIQYRSNEIRRGGWAHQSSFKNLPVEQTLAAAWNAIRGRRGEKAVQFGRALPQHKYGG